MRIYRIHHPHMLQIHSLLEWATKEIDRVLDESLDIGFSQCMILMYLAQNPKVSQRDISYERNITPAAVSRHIVSLSRRGYVVLQENRDNRREHVVELSVIGEDVIDHAARIIDRELSRIFGDLTPEELRVLEKILGRFDLGGE